MDEKHDLSQGGSYVKNADGTVTLAERGGTEPAVNTAKVVVPEHEEREAAEKQKAAATSHRRARPDTAGDTSEQPK